jgi:DEAD_2
VPVFWVQAGYPTGRGTGIFYNSLNGLISYCIQLVTLPYNLLLQKSAREALGIDLRGQVVIIDEAHSTLSIFI